MSLIGTQAANCLRNFLSIISILDRSHGSYENLLPRTALGDELGRFRVWCGNMGALQKGHNSLEYRLAE